MVCDVCRISYENFGSTIFNYENELEVQNKISLFQNFSRENIPETKPLVTDLVKKYFLTTIKQAKNYFLFKETKYKINGLFTNEKKQQTDFFSQISKINFEVERNEEDNVSDNNNKDYNEKSEKNKNNLRNINNNEDISEIMLDKLIFDEIKEEIETNFTISSLKYSKEINESLLENQSSSSKYAELEKKFNLENFFIEKTEKKWAQEKNMQSLNPTNQLQLQVLPF